jgi:hypothetical protein
MAGLIHGGFVLSKIVLSKIHIRFCGRTGCLFKSATMRSTPVTAWAKNAFSLRQR